MARTSRSELDWSQKHFSDSTMFSAWILSEVLETRQLPSKGGSVESLEGFKEVLRGLGSQSIRIMVEHLESSSDYQTSNAGARNSGLADTVRVRFRWFRSGRHA